jgi:hypothetical protein
LKIATTINLCLLFAITLCDKMELQFCVKNVDCILSVCYEILPEICTNSEILLKVGVAGKGKKLKFTLEHAMNAWGGGGIEL